MEETILPHHFGEEGGEPYLIQDVPAYVCRNCGSTQFKESTLARIDTLVAAGKPDRIIMMKTYQYPRETEERTPPSAIA